MPFEIDPPACFFLGREYDLTAKAALDHPVLYDAHHFTTHGVIVGMTGSGKTGLGIGLLEEAAIDGIPCVVIDLKGDLTNLLLNFPDLKPADLERWIDPAEAKRKKQTVAELAAKQADRWHKGLADSWQTPERIARLRESSHWQIYTPGSSAARPVALLKTFAAPREAITREDLAERVEATTTAVLGLTGVAADPLQSREHVLIANLLLHNWLAGKDLDLPRLITQVQMPPINKIGAFEIDTFYPEAERLKLALALNNILASPSFTAWIEGDPLDFTAMTQGEDGRPRQSIFYLAHLDDSQRMFFLTLLLSEFLTWTRARVGTTGLRTLLYLDEVFGYLPPHPANPPSKGPLLTLLKQARAFGVGLVLATQNPVDLDYKALTNAGTWFVGKLQTERDKARLLDGLVSVAADRGSLANRSELDKVIGSLGNRVFLMHSVHGAKPILFQTRQTLSYLAGPLTRDRLAQLALPTSPPPRPAPAVVGQTKLSADSLNLKYCPVCRTELPGRAKFCLECGQKQPALGGTSAETDFKRALVQDAASTMTVRTAHVPPVLPSSLNQFYLPAAPLPAGVAGELCYQPRLFAAADVAFVDTRRGLESARKYTLLADPPEPGQPAAWSSGEAVARQTTLAPDAAAAEWADVPKAVNDAKKLKALEKGLAEHLYESAAALIYVNKALDLTSEPGEDEPTFRARCQSLAKENSASRLVVAERAYQTQLDKAEAEWRSARAENEEARRVVDLLGQGKTMLDWLFSGPAVAKEKDKAAAQTRLLKSQASTLTSEAAVTRLRAGWEKDVHRIAAEERDKAEDVKEVRLTPRKSDIAIVQFGLAWVPYWRLPSVDGPRLAPAYAKAAARI